MDDDEQLERLLREFGISALRQGERDDDPPRLDDLNELGDDYRPPRKDDWGECYE